MSLAEGKVCHLCGRRRTGEEEEEGRGRRRCVHECKKAPLINTKFLLRNDGLDVRAPPKFVGRGNHSRARPSSRAPSRADVPPATFMRKIHSSNSDALIFFLSKRQNIIPWLGERCDFHSPIAPVVRGRITFAARRGHNRSILLISHRYSVLQQGGCLLLREIPLVRL